MTNSADRGTSSVRDLRLLPKAHLHIHLDAAMRRATLADLASEDGREVRQHNSFGDFSEFSRAYREIVSLLTTEDRMHRLIDEAVADAATHGVVAIELATMPFGYGSAFPAPEAALESILSCCNESGARHGIDVGVIVAIDRLAGPDHALSSARLAAAYAGQGVRGLGLQNDERITEAGLFEEAFAIGREAGLLAVPHAGELAGPESVRAAIELLRANRVQHGIRSVEDPSLVAALADGQVCLDVCPSSNVQLSLVESIECHPLPTLIAAGVRCTINADDPTLFGPSILDEYETCRTALGLTDLQLADCAQASIDFSTATASVKERATADISAWLSG